VPFEGKGAFRCRYLVVSLSASIPTLLNTAYGKFFLRRGVLSPGGVFVTLTLLQNASVVTGVVRL
jgi:hypothetical protein